MNGTLLILRAQGTGGVWLVSRLTASNIMILQKDLGELAGEGRMLKTASQDRWNLHFDLVVLRVQTASQ